MDINIDVLRTSMNVKNSLSRIKTLTGSQLEYHM